MLDLGAGTGLLSRRIADAHPHAELHLFDAAPAMLEQAREALGDRARIHVGDFAGTLPPGPFDAVVSSLAIHHLDNPGKRDLFARVLDALAPARDVRQRRAGDRRRRPASTRSTRPGTSARASRWAPRTQEWDESLERRAFDRCATVADQLRGSPTPASPTSTARFQDHLFAVLVARRPYA